MPDTFPSPDLAPIDPFRAAGFAGQPDCLLARLDGEAADLEALTSDERARAGRLLSPARRAERVSSLILRRRLIALMTGADAGCVSITAADDGAPMLITPAGYALSIANKGVHTVVALAAAPAEIGVDVEIVRALDWRPMLAMLCDDEERGALDRWLGDQADPNKAFLRMWTLKEAALKSTGLGFRAGPKRVRTPIATMEAPGEGRLGAFGRTFDFWTADRGNTIISLVAARR